MQNRCENELMLERSEERILEAIRQSVANAIGARFAEVPIVLDGL